MMSGRGYRSAFAAGILIAAAGICKYSAAVFLPVVAVLGVLAPLPPRRALLRGCLFFVYGLLGMLAVLVPFASFIIPGIAFTTSNRVALNPRPLSLLLAEFGRGAGLLTVIAAAAVIVLLHRWWTRRDRPSLQVAATAVVLAGAGLAIPLGQFRMHEYVSFNKHLAFLAIFLAPIAAQLVTVAGRVVKGVAFTTAVYLLAVGALFRSSFMFTEWPDTTPVSEAVAHYGRPGTYLAYAGNTMAFYAKDRPDMTFEEYYALFGAGKPAIKAAIDQGTYVGVTFVTGSTGDADLDENTAYLISLLNESTRYEPVGSWPKHEYDANRFYLYLRTS
ncbi:hypothetical protein [Actinoplanes subglobosus]|uniref:Glycosyltransferase RgtA/B/C/D-like domain-containing protein n=1 Tax=Actinoplanes subglobosus TaxID=1547892 RepID=A0ABV8J079_9ACTN